MERSSNTDAFSVVSLILSQLEDSLKRYKQLYNDPKHGVNGSSDDRIHRYPPGARGAIGECFAKGDHLGPRMYCTSEREARDYGTQIRTYYKLLKLTEPLLDSSQREVLTQEIDELQQQFPEAKCYMTFYA